MEKTPRATITSTDPDVLVRFVGAMGCGSLIPNKRVYKPQHKPQYQWYTKAGEFYRVYALLRPWLSPRRTAAAEKATAIFNAHANHQLRERACAYCDRSFAPENLRRAGRRKYCTTACERLAQSARKRDRAVFNPQRAKLPEDA